VTFTCGDLDDVLRDGDADAWSAARGHAQTCDDCRERLAAWDEITAQAPQLHHEWETPALWSRIETALARERRARRRPAGRIWLGLAAVLLAGVAGTWLFVRVLAPPRIASENELPQRLLSEGALRDVERAEADYVRSIEALSRAVAPETPATPLMMSYREKLMLIDAAIAECRAQIERNRFNAHLRRELLGMYREKQKTLQQIEKEDNHAS
jgi:hypothetical protein